MSISYKYQSLISALFDATEERRIKWETTSVPNEFQTVINKSIVSVRRYECYDALGNCNDKPRYSLHLKNKDGDIIDTYSGGNSGTRNEPEYLYDVVRRSYFKVEETIDAMISVLG